MRAAVHDRYGPPEVIQFVEVARPVPGDRDVLVRVHATTVNRSDCGFRAADPFFARAFTGILRPRRRILGRELAGVVEAVGPAVTEFEVGDEVFGLGPGANAEFVCVPEDAAIVPKPSSTSFDQAASIPDGACIALACLRKAGVGPGTRILVYGASGSIGTASVQIAKALGAHVTAVCGTSAVDIVGSLGPDEVIDYLRDDFTRNGATYDVVFDAVGKHSFRRSRGSLEAGGTFVETDLGFMWHVPLLALASRAVGTRRVMLPIPAYTKADMTRIRELVEAGSLRAVVDRRYPLEQVREATRYVETGTKIGNVVLTVAL